MHQLCSLPVLPLLTSHSALLALRRRLAELGLAPGLVGLLAFVKLL